MITLSLGIKEDLSLGNQMKVMDMKEAG
jgi:hypothetical protein